MKKILSFIAVFAGLLAFAPVVHAQDGKPEYNKTISPPDPNGVYTISLEAYVTGSKITTETAVAPADIVLVMSYNSSYDNALRAAVKNAVANFVNIIKASNENVQVDDSGGHRVAFVYFGNRKIGAGAPYNTFLNVENLTAEAYGPSTGGAVTYTPSNTDMFPANNEQNGSSYSGDGMNMADSIIGTADDNHNYDNDGSDHNEEYDNTLRSKIIVFFTNAAPGAQSMSANWNNTVNSDNNKQADICVNKSYGLKNLGTVVYSIAIDSEGKYAGNYTPDKFTTWLNYVSSDNTEHANWIEGGSIPQSYVDVTDDYSMIAANAGALDAIFSSIANTVGGDYSASSSSSVLIDIVATSFFIPTDTELGEVSVYAVPCTKSSATALTSFDDVKEEYKLTTTENEDEVDPENDIVFLSVDEDTGEVVVTGFDYGAEWCGWEKFADGTGQAHGRKIVLQIPVLASPTAVGGPGVLTNAPGSGLIIKDKDGNPIGDMLEFASPKVSLPVNIHIEKEGLDEGESAKFMIERASLPQFWYDIEGFTPADLPEEAWSYVSTVFVTNSKEKTPNIKWTSDGNPMVMVRGLPAEMMVTIDGEDVRRDVVYRIKEEGWAWSYVQDPTEPQYTVTSSVNNPFKFVNTKKDNIDVKVRHAESKATNIFKTGGGAYYDDSKTNVHRAAVEEETTTP